MALDRDNIGIRVANWDTDTNDWPRDEEENILYTDQAQLTLVRFDRSIVRPQSASIVDQTIKHDAVGVLNQGARVQITDDNWTTYLFQGFIRIDEPQGIVKQGKKFLAVDFRWLMEKEIYARVNGSYAYKYNSDGHSTHDIRWGNLKFWRVGEIIIDLLEHALDLPDEGGGPSDIPSHHWDATLSVTDTFLTTDDIAAYTAADILACTTEVDSFEINGTRLGAAITQLLEIQRDYTWKIDANTGNLEVIDLTAAAALNVNAGEVDHFVDESGKNYFLMDDPMQRSLDGVYTKISIQGAAKYTEAKPPNITDPAGIGAGSTGTYELRPAWDSTLTGGATPWTLAKFNNGDYTGDDSYEWVYRRLRMKASHHHPWAQGIIETGIFSGMVFYKSGANYRRVRNNIGGVYSSYLDYGTVLFASPLAGAYRTADYAVWCFHQDPFVVTVGPTGSAYTNYGYEGHMVIYDESFEHSTTHWPTTGDSNYFGIEIRDDTTRMTNLANRIVAVTAKEKIFGEWVVDQIDLDTYTIEKKLNLANLAQWSTIGLYVFHIDCDVANDTMKISVANRVDAVSINGISMFQSNLLRFRRDSALRAFRRTLHQLRRVSVKLMYAGI